MESLTLTAEADEQIAAARAASSGRSARTIHGNVTSGKILLLKSITRRAMELLMTRLESMLSGNRTIAQL